MSKPDLKFHGFNAGIFKFFNDLSKNNSLEWFSKNRERYQEVLVSPAKEFVESIGEFFNHLNPAIRNEPKFNKTLMRINKDMRFAKGDPYRTYFLIHFGRFKMDSEFYVYFDKNGLVYGMFLNNSKGDDLYFKENLPKFRKEISNIFKKNKLNNKFSLYTYEKDTSLIQKKFNIDKHFDDFISTKYILLENPVPKTNKLATSPTFLNTAIKTFSKLYPLYCFAISPDPLKLLQDFEEKLGIAH